MEFLLIAILGSLFGLAWGLGRARHDMAVLIAKVDMLNNKLNQELVQLRLDNYNMKQNKQRM